MPKTINGRPQKIGEIYFEREESGAMIKKYNIGYCENCGKKYGLTREELKEMAENMPGIIPEFVVSLYWGLKEIRRLVKR